MISTTFSALDELGSSVTACFKPDGPTAQNISIVTYNVECFLTLMVRRRLVEIEHQHQRRITLHKR
jgi:hypothetical protein